MTTFNRNLRNLDNKTGQKIVNILTDMTNNHDRYSRAYFWTPPQNASGRRQMEFTEKLSFRFNGKRYEWEQELSCSCKNVYWTSAIYVDGQKKNIRAIKALMK